MNQPRAIKTHRDHYCESTSSHHIPTETTTKPNKTPSPTTTNQQKSQCKTNNPHPSLVVTTASPSGSPDLLRRLLYQVNLPQQLPSSPCLGSAKRESIVREREENRERESVGERETLLKWEKKERWSIELIAKLLPISSLVRVKTTICCSLIWAFECCFNNEFIWMQKLNTTTKQPKLNPNPPVFVFKYKILVLKLVTKHALSIYAKLVRLLSFLSL